MPLNITNANVAYSNPGGIGTNPFTIEGWFYLDVVLQQQYLVHLGNTGHDGASGFYTLIQCAVDGTLQVLIGAAGPYHTSPSLTAKRWYYIVVTCTNSVTDFAASGGGIKIYVNGVDVSNPSGAPGFGAALDHNSVISVSGRHTSTNRNINRGTVHRVRVYNTVASPTDIAAAYAAPTSVLDLATVYASALKFKTDYDTTTSGSPGGTPGISTGTATLTARYPGDIPGLAFRGNYASGSNTITSTRVATLADLSGNGNNAVEVSSSGPKQSAVPDALSTHGDYSQFSTKYIQQAASGGLVTDRQCFSFVRFGNTDKLGLGVRQAVIHAGDPAGTVAVEVEIDATGLLTVDVGGGSSPKPSQFMTVCNPRMFGVTCSSTGIVLYNDERTTTGSALSTGTSTGFRIGAVSGSIAGSGASADRPFNGCAFEDLIYQRVLNAAEMATLGAYGQGIIGYSYVTATKSITMEGSSTFDGYNADASANIAIQMAHQFPAYWIFNFANTSENRTHFNSQYSTQSGAAAALAGFTKANRIMLLQPYGNDWSNTGTPTLATVEGDYATFTTSVSGDYGSRFAMYPQPRTSHPTETWTDADDVQREADLLTFMTWLRGTKGWIVTKRPAFATPTANTAAALHVVTIDGYPTYYQNDETHLNALGLDLLGESIANTMLNTLAPWGARGGLLLLY